MKYLVFLAFSAAAVPAVALLVRRPIWLGRILGLLVFSTALGDVAGVNFFSLESYRGPDRGFEITLTDLLALGIVLGLLPKAQKRVPPDAGLMGVFFVWSVMSALAGPEFMLSAYSLFKLVRIFLIYWAVTLALDSGATLRSIVLGMVAAGLFVGQLAARQKYLMGIYRIPGPFDHSNTVPLYINLMLPLVTAWAVALGRPGWERRVAGVAVLGMLFAVLATFSRAGAAITMSSVMATILLAQRYTPSRSTRRTGLVLAILLTAGAGVAADSFIDRIRNAPESSADAREEFNIAARAMAVDHPLGVGLNRFPEVLTTTVEYRSHIRVMGTEEHAGVAHHIYWLTAAELGWFGLFLFLVFMLRLTVRAMRHGRQGAEALAFGCLTIGLMSMHLAGLLEWAFRITPVTSLFAVIAALTTMACKRPKTKRAKTKRRAMKHVPLRNTWTERDPGPLPQVVSV